MDIALSFDAAAGVDTHGTITAYEWNFGDESDLGTGVSTSHDYTTAGTFTAELTVTDNEGATAMTPVEIVVELANLAPTAVIAADPTTGIAPLTVIFDSTGSSDSADTHQLLVTGTLNDASEDDVTADLDTLYTSDDDTIATVDATGLITAVTAADGVATVTVSRTDASVPSIDVTVYVSAITLYDSLNVEPSPLDLEVGDMQELTDEGLNICDPTQTTDLSDDLDTAYASDDTEVAIVSSSGIVQAEGVGTAIITVSRADGSALPVDVMVNVTQAPLEPLDGSIVVTAGDDDGYGIVLPDTTISLDMVATGGVGELTYEWAIDPSGTTDPLLTEDVFSDHLIQTPTFTPPLGVQGTYQITCTVTDEVLDTFTPEALTIIATTLTAEPTVDGNDGCIVGLPSGNDIPGADFPGVFTDDQFETMTWLANSSGGFGDLSYSWSSDVGSFDDPNVQDAEWFVPFVEEETIVTFTLTITDDLGIAPADLALTFEVSSTSRRRYVALPSIQRATPC